ncbi:Defective in cullin neddylation protein 1 [Fulvia fulva]|uniref:Defective in cullin neddylation protein n=1 Tax=Passalora fulva TaxID=5499 RepID=A0A9Q8P551_PASFU|nr:Defective in cullin neddylation protein 1 [Fulvia fulva]KAK4632097.1 Defective in cullin neddylation protein 1 [Fulvia fulva]KAK4633450.1 Defective in cullin neddylation protein 1 [Fulvia fulva]UJO13770.1 Defective in cullin neddylation protein 1 [Fulvia fulva]WPV11204.1 Defective in cullin neddylation protein 1 [Fulvia fulva]WPV26412.1 Defective in cullin neddylation protein 1 [Fulvia fulva]
MPPAYTSSQKSAIAEFSNVTQADKSTAAKLLKQHSWNVGAAVNTFFNNPSAGGANSLRSSLSKTFDQYRDNPKDSPDEITIDGTGKLLEDAGIAVDGVDFFIFSELVASPSMGTLAREGFVDGLSDVGADTPAKIRNIVLQRRSALNSDPELLKNVYNHAFQLGLQDRQKALPVEMAQEFWKILFTAPAYQWRTNSSPWLDWWFEFYTEKVNKAVNKDLWKQTLSFAKETMRDESLSFWTDESSWPSVIDEFVEWVKTQKKTGDAMEIS